MRVQATRQNIGAVQSGSLVRPRAPIEPHIWLAHSCLAVLMTAPLPRHPYDPAPLPQPIILKITQMIERELHIEGVSELRMQHPEAGSFCINSKFLHTTGEN